MDRSVYHGQSRLEAAETVLGFSATVGRAIVHDPEDAARVVVRRSSQHLLDQPVKGRNAVFEFAAAKDSGVVDVQGGDIGPGTATEVLVFDTHGCAWPAGLRGVFAAAGLDAHFFIG